jgi:hypothetical protein
MSTDDFGTKVIAAGVATAGHGLYLAYKFVRHGRVNDVSIGLFVFMVVLTAVGTVAYLRLKRTEEGSRSWSISGDGDERGDRDET